MNTMKKIHVFVPVTLGMLTAFGPFVTDFYLPVLPEMKEYFTTSPSLVSMSLTAGMVGLAAGQILIGPLTDKYGRKHILTFTMLMFAIASVACIFAPDIFIFNAMRVLQGLAGAGGIVISKSMATDMYSGRDLAHFMGVLAAINGIAPVFAPIVGGTMASFASWQGVFCLMLAIGLVLMVCSMFLSETLQPEQRKTGSIAHVYGNLFRVFRNSLFSLSVFAMMASFFTFFAYIASSPFILQNVYGMSPFMFSLCFSTNAVMIAVGSAIGSAIRRQNRALANGAAIMMAASVLVAACLAMRSSIYLLMASYMCLMVGFGIMQPVTTAIALDSERNNAGAASAIFGAACFVGGSLSSPLVSLGEITVTSGFIMIAGGVVCAVVTALLCIRISKTRIATKN